jgi:hypothetical protein
MASNRRGSRTNRLLRSILTQRSSFLDECAADAPREGTVTCVNAARATDVRASESATGVTASEAAALAPAASVASTSTVATVAATAATATTGQSAGCHGSGSDRDGRDHDDCSVQPNSPHSFLPSGIELTSTLIVHHPPECTLRSAPDDVDGRRSKEPTGSRYSDIDADGSRVRNSVLPKLLVHRGRSFQQGREDHRKRARSFFRAPAYLQLINSKRAQASRG